MARAGQPAKQSKKFNATEFVNSITADLDPSTSWENRVKTAVERGKQIQEAVKKVSRQPRMQQPPKTRRKVGPLPALSREQASDTLRQIALRKRVPVGPRRGY
jgi:hypothetical protein